MPDEYVIGSGLTEQQLQVASWWVRRAPVLQEIGMVALIAVTAFFWGFGLWQFADAFLFSYGREAAIPRHMIVTALSPAGMIPPQNIQASDVMVFQDTDNRQDFLVQITNPNQQWWPEFDYTFNAQGESTPVRHTYVLPNSQRYVTELGWKGQALARNAEFKPDKIIWHRVRPEDVNRDATAFFNDRYQFQFDGAAYANDLKIDGHIVGQTSSTLRNPAGYGFWSVDITAILYRGTMPVAVTTINQKEIKPGEERPFVINWFENLMGITKTELQANVNILDPSSYLPSGRF